jgi:hypothetical protein
MRDTRNNFAVALTKCFFCIEDYEIVLNSRLTKKDAEQVEAMHGKIINMEPCPKCQEWMSKDVLLISVRNDSLAEISSAYKEKRMPNPYRTGRLVVITDDAIKRLLDAPTAESIIKRRWCFIPDDAWNKMGLGDLAKQGE